MSRFAAIDLSQLPPPDVVEALDFETIFTAMLNRYKTLDPDYSADQLESDPIVKLLQEVAYRELGLRQRVNDAARQRMLAYATGTNLDQMAADAGVSRLLLDAGDPDATPPIPPTFESDEDLRARTQLAPEALTTAGSEGSYIFNGLSVGETPRHVEIQSPTPGTVTLTYTFDPASVAARIKDASAASPTPGDVIVTVLSYDGDGTVDQPTLDAVAAHLSSRYVRPLCDAVIIQGASIQYYQVTAVLDLYDGPDPAVVKAAAEASLATVAARRHALGESVTLDVIDAALHVAGVRRVTLTGWTDVICTKAEAPYMTASTVTTVPAS